MSEALALAETRRRRCKAITKKGAPCSSFAIHGSDLCVGHSGIGVKAASEGRTRAAQERANARKQARMSVAERAALALNEDWEDVLSALRAGLRDTDKRKAAAVAIQYVQLVYGRQLQQPTDERTEADPLDVASMSREERQALKQRILTQHPHLVRELRGEDIAEP